ncbi:protein SERAC1 [Aricia agestis]|uniref:protein SERAC1 n=1 Tax=Aricia agestis TaxID=91739 RepID=UPI001C20BD87|nr:protein SERAC1 [Aricia agestis]
MSLRERLKPALKILKAVSICGSGVLLVAYHLNKTYASIDRIINSNVLDAEKKFAPEYIYIDDPSFDATIKAEHNKQEKQTVGLARIWKSLKYSLAWKLLWLCRHGTKEQRSIAIEQLAAFKNNKVWDCFKLAQALDKNTAVLLARTRGADLRYFLPPPIHVRRAASTSDLLSFKLRDMIAAVQKINPHGCIHYFLNKYFVNMLDHVMEVDSAPAKPDSISEKDLCLLCLDALYHHVSLFNNKTYAEDSSAQLLIKLGILPKLAEALLRYRNDIDIDLAVLRLLTVLSVHSELLTDFFQNGLIGELSRLLRASDIRLSSSAAVCLVNLSGEFCYRPGLYLLHPIYRTRVAHTCDTLLVHGLRGGVFVTWRQRDKSCREPVGFRDAAISDIDSELNKENLEVDQYLDPDMQQVIHDIIESEEETLLSTVEVVLEDLPIAAKREVVNEKYTAKQKRVALQQEKQDRIHYTQCWPKDWLPKDCDNIRVVGVNYWSTLSDWLERCPLQNAEITARAQELSDKLYDADVGKHNIIWLAHSMGGLIVKKILTDIAETSDSPYKPLCEKTKAIVFYSTPHKGSSLASMPRAASAILWPSKDVKQLRENSPMLLEMHNSFIKIADKLQWETISFAETLPTLVTAFKVPIHFVEPHSADLGRGVYYQLPLDHLSICKPATRQSILYTSVLNVLLDAATQEAQVKVRNPLIQRIIDLIYIAISTKIRVLVDVFEQHESPDVAKINDILLQASTDDFVI